MSKDATIRFRASRILKQRLEAAAARREQTISDYVRSVAIAAVEAEEDRAHLRRAGLSAVSPPAKDQLYPEPKSQEPKVAEQESPVAIQSNNPDPAAKEERRIDRILKREQKKKDSALLAPKPAAPAKSGAKAAE